MIRTAIAVLLTAIVAVPVAAITPTQATETETDERYVVITNYKTPAMDKGQRHVLGVYKKPRARFVARLLRANCPDEPEIRCRVSVAPIL